MSKLLVESAQESISYGLESLKEVDTRWHYIQELVHWRSFVEAE